MSPERIGVFAGIVIGSALYAPIAVYVFGHDPSVMIDRAFFTLLGAVLMTAAHPSPAETRQSEKTHDV